PFTAARCGASEVVLVDGVLVGVVVGVGGAAGNGVGLVEAAGVGVLEADSHQRDGRQGVVGALFGAEPAVAGVGGGLEVGQAEFGGFGVAGVSFPHQGDPQSLFVQVGGGAPGRRGFWLALVR